MSKKLIAKSLIALCLMLCASFAFADNSAEMAVKQNILVEPVKGLSDDFIKGVDISSLSDIEKAGGKFYNAQGKEADIFEILKENGVNWVRLRIWNNPTYAEDLYDATYLGEGNLVHYMSYYSNDITTQFELFEDVTTDGTNKVASTLTQNSSWYYDYGTSSLVYTIPLEKIGNAKVGDSIRVFVARSVNDDSANSIAECCPTSAIKLSDGSNIVSSWEAQSVVIDMSKALEYVIE